MPFFQIVETRHALSLHQSEEINGKQIEQTEPLEACEAMFAAICCHVMVKHAE